MTDKKVITRIALLNGGEVLANGWSEMNFWSKEEVNYVEILHSPSMTQLMEFRNFDPIRALGVITALVQGFANVFNRFDANIVDRYVRDSFVLNVTGSSNLLRIQRDRAYGVGELLTFILVQMNRHMKWYSFSELPDDRFDRFHFSKFVQRDVSTLRDLRMMLNPRDFQYGEDQFDLMFAFAGKINYNSNLSSPAFREIVRYFCSVENLGNEASNKNMKLRDLELIPDNEINGGKNVITAINGLPLKTKMYRDYLLDLPVLKIAILLESDLSFIKPSASAKGGIQLTESFLKSSENNTNAAVLVHETYCALFAKIDEIPESKRFGERYSDLLSRLYDQQSSMNTMHALKAHFEKGSEKLPWDELDKTVNMVLVPAKIKKWLSSPAQSEAVISSLWESVGERAIEVLLTVVEEGQSLSPSQWLAVAEKYDELKEVPVSWWVSMAL